MPDIKSIIKSYIDFSNSCNYNAIADLFAENADWIPIEPMDRKKGREAIRAGYLEHVKSKNKPIVNVIYYVDHLTCVAEFEVQVEANKTVSIVDIFKFNESNEIISLSVYRK